MNRPDDDDSHKRSVRRRNLRTALLLGLVALGFYVAFFYTMSHRGH